MSRLYCLYLCVCIVIFSNCIAITNPQECFIFQSLANSKLAIAQENYQEAFINSKTALLFVEDEKKFDEYTFVALLELAIASDHVNSNECDLALGRLSAYVEDSNALNTYYSTLTVEDELAIQQLLELTQKCDKITTKNKLDSIIYSVFTGCNESDFDKEELIPNFSKERPKKLKDKVKYILDNADV